MYICKKKGFSKLYYFFFVLTSENVIGLFCQNEDDSHSAMSIELCVLAKVLCGRYSIVIKFNQKKKRGLKNKKTYIMENKK